MAKIPDDLADAIFNAPLSKDFYTHKTLEPLNIPEDIAVESFRSFLLEHITPCDPNFKIIINASGDKTVHRFDVAGHHAGNQDGRYVLYTNECPAGWVQDMSQHSEPIKFVFDIAGYRREYSGIANIIPQRKDTKEKTHSRPEASAAKPKPTPEDVARELGAMAPATDSNLYLASKKVSAVAGLLENNGDLILPYYDKDGIARSYQRINKSGKWIAKGTSLSDAFFVIGGNNKGRLPTMRPFGAIQICEGIATGLTLHRSILADLTIVTGGTSNLTNVVRIIKEWSGWTPDNNNGMDIYIMADDDYKPDSDKNAGRDAAIKAARECGLPDYCVFTPPFDHDADAGLTDWNDFEVKYGRDATYTAILETIKTFRAKDNQARRESVNASDGGGTSQTDAANGQAQSQSADAERADRDVSASSGATEQQNKEAPKTREEQIYNAIKEITLQSTMPLDTNQPAPELDYIANLFPRGYYSLLAAAPGVGKTFLLERIAVDLSLGGEILDGFGYSANPLTTLIMSGEAGTGLLIRRARMMHWTPNSEYIKIFDAKKTARALGGINLDKEEGQFVLKILLDEYRPDIVFVDSLTSFFSGSFNKQEDVTPLIMRAAEFAEIYNCAIVLVHHIRKRMVKERETPLDLDDVVGSGALARNCAVAIGIERVASLDMRQDAKLVKCLKDWERKHPRPFTFEIRDGLYHKEMYIDLNVKEEVANPTVTKSGQVDKKANQTTGLFERLQSVLDATKPFLKKGLKEKLKEAGYNYSDTSLFRGIEQLIKRKSIYTKGTQRYAVYFFTDYYEGPDFNKEMCKALHDGSPLEDVYKLAEETREETKKEERTPKEKTEDGNLELDI